MRARRMLSSLYRCRFCAARNCAPQPSQICLLPFQHDLPPALPAAPWAAGFMTAPVLRHSTPPPLPTHPRTHTHRPRACLPLSPLAPPPSPLPRPPLLPWRGADATPTTTTTTTVRRTPSAPTWHTCAATGRCSTPPSGGRSASRSTGALGRARARRQQQAAQAAAAAARPDRLPPRCRRPCRRCCVRSRARALR